MQKGLAADGLLNFLPTPRIKWRQSVTPTERIKFRQRRGVRRLIFTHPEDIVDASMNDVQGIAAMGAAVEHSLAFFLEGSKFKTCSAADLRKHAGAAHVSEDVDSADLSGVSGTPTFFVNGRRHYGAYDIETLSKAVKLALARAKISA